MLNQLAFTDWIVIINAVVMIFNMVHAITNSRRAAQHDITADVKALSQISTDIEYIKLELKKLEEIPTRIRTLEVRTDHMQKQIDEMNRRTKG